MFNTYTLGSCAHNDVRSSIKTSNVSHGYIVYIIGSKVTLFLSSNSRACTLYLFTSSSSRACRTRRVISVRFVTSRFLRIYRGSLVYKCSSSDEVRNIYNIYVAPTAPLLFVRIFQDSHRGPYVDGDDEEHACTT